MVTIAQVGSDLPTLWILTGRDGSAGRRADGGIDVELLESNALLGQAVDIRRLGSFVAEAGKISPSHVVNEDQYDVWLCAHAGEGAKK